MDLIIISNNDYLFISNAPIYGYDILGADKAYDEKIRKCRNFENKTNYIIKQINVKNLNITNNICNRNFETIKDDFSGRNNIGNSIAIVDEVVKLYKFILRTRAYENMEVLRINAIKKCKKTQ